MTKKDDQSTLTFHPPKLWGLDFYFQTFNKLYIADILCMPPYDTFPEAFAYGNHPIYRVDILGIVVKVDSKLKAFIYAIDDGTGVISCLCWKKSFLCSENPVLRRDSSGLPSILRSRLISLEEEEGQAQSYELGDLIHIRGKLKQFRDMMEVVAVYHSKKDNPSFQIARMQELPLLYRKYYDKPFKFPYKVEQELQKTRRPDSSTNGKTLEDIIEIALQQKKLKEFGVSDLLAVKDIADLVSKVSTECDCTTAVMRALSSLEAERGVVCHRKDFTQRYENLTQKCQLDKLILSLLQRECSKPKYAEKGCHYLHILDELHKCIQYASVKEKALLYILNRLETDSDIIRISDKCYFPFRFST